MRILTLYGPGDHGEKFVPYLLECLKEGRDAETSPGGQVWDFLHVSDAASALLSAATTKDFKGLYVLASGEAWALKDVASFLFKEAQKYIKVPQLKLGARSYGSAELMCLEGDSSTLQKASGWRPKVKLEEGLSELVRETLGPSAQR
jgi:nucleoside-diphosphate-sugar epimerase